MADMSAPYRDEKESLRTRVELLEGELNAKERVVDDLEHRLADQDAVFTRLQTVIDQRGSRRVGTWFFALAAAFVVVGSAGLRVAASRSAPPAAVAMAAGPAAPAAESAPAVVGGDPCRSPGVHLNVAGEDAEAPAIGDRDLAGHKYRRDGQRAAWFTLQNGGPLYVHAVGDALPADVGTTKLSLLTILTRGASGGYALARDGKSLLEVQGADGQRVWGRFEADVSKVADTTREPPFGTAVVRVRGTFCLPAQPANPSDTGP